MKTTNSNEKLKKILMWCSVGLGALVICGAFVLSIIKDYPECDGINITANCKADGGVIYKTYIYNEAQEEISHIEHIPAKEEVFHYVHHEPEYGTREVRGDCIRTNISYKYGTCALSKCADGTYSGSSGWGTCNYHGGVVQTGGPWYTTKTERYVIKEAWDEKIVDKPAEPAHDKKVVDREATEAYYTKIKK